MTEISENNIIEDKSAINDIDFPLYKYGIMFRYDINNYFDTEIKKTKQKFKSKCMSLWLFLNLFHYFLCLMFIKNGKTPNYFFDIIPHIGGITQFFYLMSILGLILALRVINLFNNKNIDYFRWLEIIEVLKGLKNMDTIEMNDKNQFKIFIKKINILTSMLKISVKLNAILLTVMPITVLILFYDIKDLIIYGILSGFKFFGFFYFGTAIILYSFLYYFIVCYYCKVRFRLFNDKLKRMKKIKKNYRHKEVLDLIKEHNRICYRIFMHNKFWRKYSFAMVYSLIPCNLMNLQQLFFEDINIGIRGLALVFAIGTLFELFRLNSIMASINSEASKSYKFLFKLFLDMKSNMNLSIKIKVFILYYLQLITEFINTIYICIRF